MLYRRCQLYDFSLPCTFASLSGLSLFHFCTDPIRSASSSKYIHAATSVQLKQFFIWIAACHMITIWFNCNKLGLSGYAECYVISKAAGILTLVKGQKRQNQKLLIQLLLSSKGAGCLWKAHIFLPTPDTHVTLFHTTQTLIGSTCFFLLFLQKNFRIASH